LSSPYFTHDASRIMLNIDWTPLAITVHSVVAPSGELRGKGRCGVFAGKIVWSTRSTPERLRGSHDEALYKSTFTYILPPLGNSWL